MWHSSMFLMKQMTKKRWLWLGYSALLLECITPIMAVLLQRNLIDQVFIGRQYGEFSKLVALYALFFFGPKLWFTVRKVTFFHMGYHLQMTLTEQFLKKIYRLPTAVFNTTQVGQLMNTMRNDIADASDTFVNQLLSEAVFVLVTVIFLTVSIASISWPLLLVVVCVAAVYYVLLQAFSVKTKQYAQSIRTEKGYLSVRVEESVSAVREIVAYNAQEWQMNRYETQFQKYFKAILREGRYKIKILFVSEPFLYGTKLVVILFGGMSAMSNNVSLGEFVVSFTLVDQLVTAMGQLFQLSLTGKRLTAPVEKIEAVMHQEDVRFGSVNLMDAVKSIEFKNVTFSHSSALEPVLDNLTLSFPVGKKIALVGESGSGKSTIAQLLLRMHAPQSGEVTINGVPIQAYGKGFADKVAVVFQQPHFLPTSIIENLVFDGTFEPRHIESVCQDMLCHDFIEAFPQQYETQVGERGTSLSGGQKQRLALSRAMLKNADVLILDEATSALDTETEYCVSQNMDRLRKGKTTIVIAHRLSTILNADVIYVLSQGKVVAQGTHEKLVAESSVYQELYAGLSVG